jgi:hypothetical protein
VVVTGYDCCLVNRAGKRTNKNYSRVIAAARDAITVHDSGGVACRIAWTIVATDASGNSSIDPDAAGTYSAACAAAPDDPPIRRPMEIPS